MDYSFSGMGTRNFEHLAQALTARATGSRLSVFGDGADGGREAVWDGEIEPLSGSEKWIGYGVMQAKMKGDETSVPAANLVWLKSELESELRKWAAPDSKRARLPEYFLAVTNVKLSPGNGGGKEAIANALDTLVSELGLPIRASRVWDYDDLRSMIETDSSIRRTYAAWTTPGDVLARLLDVDAAESEAFRSALRAHAARSLVDDNLLNLRQAGSVSDVPVTMADVFIDLPATSGSTKQYPQSEHTQLVSTLVRWANGVPSALVGEGPAGAVIVGGPGQGKSTLTQYIAQLYRAAFLRGSRIADEPNVKAHIDALTARSGLLETADIEGRRWPVRVLLTDLADALSGQTEQSLLSFLAEKISRRSAVDVSKGQMRSWLKEYPWLLIVDGLDEVPNSSNRSQVMQCLRDFFMDVADVEGNVVVVATTRPQEYGHEFSNETFTHFELSALPIKLALAYADSLVGVRLGTGSESSERIMKSLRVASNDKSTARLFASPLQVSILTVLIETLGHVPRDRWKLFSNYYRVITQREQEKPGELAQLLRDYGAEVDYIHRYVGNLLQTRSAGTGETSSFLTIDEFETVIKDRLREQGHNPDEVERLSAEFGRLATNRLVFLAKLTAERVGFEIRSLQEFMAAEHIVARSEMDIIPELTRIAPTPHWRNTFLFAVGCIFSTRQALKAEIPILCANLAHFGNRHTPYGVGKDLALDVLLDGSASTQPRFARLLAETASELIDGQITTRARDLASLAEPVIAEIVMARAASTLPALAPVWLNRAEVLSELEQRGIPTAIESTFVASPEHVKLPLMRLAWSRSSQALLRGASQIVKDVDPAKFLPRSYLVHRSNDVEDQANMYASDSFFSALTEIFYPEGSLTDVQVRPLEDDRPSPLSYEFVGIASNESAWAELLGRELEGGTWELLKSVAKFSADPSTEHLATILDIAAQRPLADLQILEHAPWVVMACIENAMYFGQWLEEGSTAVRSRLSFLGLAARNGLLGMPVDWVAAESKWRSPTFEATIGAVAPRLPDNQGGDWDAPVWTNQLSEGGILSCGSFGITVPSDEVYGRDLVLLAESLLQVAIDAAPGSEASAYADLGVFTLSSLRNDHNFLSKAGVDICELPRWVDREGARQAMASVVGLPRPKHQFTWGYGRPGILALPDPEDRADSLSLDYLEYLGGTRRLIRANSGNLAEWVLHGSGLTLSWRLIRLAIHLNPMSALSIDEGVYRAIGDSAVERRLASFLRIANASADSIAVGALDDDIRVVVVEDSDPDQANRDSLDSTVLFDLCESCAPERRERLAEAVVRVLEDVDPFEAFRFYALAKRNLSEAKFKGDQASA